MNFLPLTAKTGELLMKMFVNQNPVSTGNTEQNHHVYQKRNSIVTENSQANFASAALTPIHVDLLAGRALKS